MKNNITEKLLGSKKRRIATTLVVVSFLIIFFYAEHLMAGSMFVLGTQNLEPLDGRFSAQNTESVEDENPWIQDSYQDEIDSLSEREYYVTQQNGTEPPFQNKLYDEKRRGIYVDVVSGEPLFSSKHKFDSGTGWPSFYKPLEPENIIERKDPGPLGTRVEIASRHARSHLGHLFRDGPEDKTGLRYCMNSAALEFIPAGQLEDRGYGKYSWMFENRTE